MLISTQGMGILEGRQSGRKLGVGSSVRARIVSLSSDTSDPRRSKIGLTCKQSIGSHEWIHEDQIEWSDMNGKEPFACRMPHDIADGIDQCPHHPFQPRSHQIGLDVVVMDPSRSEIANRLNIVTPEITHSK